ncbi:hypothetical protein [Pseudomonas sp. UV AK001]|uniref:hypothetical protein n=1 Tax=Pseudomonas sp. UV AK001 TaxID=3384791 RepID=UPI0038D50A81
MSSSSVSSQTWLQNFRPYVNGVKVRWPDLHLHLVAGECVDLTLEFEYSYLIGDPESPLKLCCEPDGELLGLVCDPPFGQVVEMEEGLIELTWHICARKTFGAPFELHFEMPFYKEMPPSPKVPGTIFNLADALEIKFDAMTTTSGATAYACHGAKHYLNVLPLDETFLNEKVRLLRTEHAGVEILPVETSIRNLYQSGVSWLVDCSNSVTNGVFYVVLEFVDLGFKLSLLRFEVDHHLVTAERWVTEYWNSKTYSIRATSKFLGTPVAGVQVQNKGVDYEKTDARG